jgi:hypothetical protein
MKEKESKKKLRDDEDPESVALNEKIAQFAQRKQLREAKVSSQHDSPQTRHH